MNRSISATLALAGAGFLLMACLSNTGTATNNAEASYATTFSVKELMDAMVDPAADGIWGSVAVISDKTGLEKREPRTPEEWHAVRQHVIRLIESMNLVTMPGRHAAPEGAKRGAGELSSQEIDALLASERETFVAFGKELQAVTAKALDAVGARDPSALFKVGSEIDEACEACHQTFWYPKQD